MNLAALADKPPKNIFFRGWGYTDNLIIVGEAGLKEFLQKGGSIERLSVMDGRYLLGYQKDNFFNLKSDQFGSEPIFYFHSCGEWAVSNSFLALCEHLQENQITLSLDDDVLSAFQVNHSLCQQLIGHRTLAKEIKLAPPGFDIEIELATGWVFLKQNLKAFSELSYEELLIRGLSQSVSVARSLMEKFPGKISADITGGYDSRIVLGILNKASPNLAGVNFCSNINSNNDYKIASALAEKYNFVINNVRAPPVHAGGKKRYHIWKYHNLGVYLPLHQPLITDEKWFHFHGGGGEILRDFYVNTPRQTVKVLESKAGKRLFGLTTLLSDFCNHNNLCPDSLHSMREFYAACRSRLHFGRVCFTTFSSNLIMPILTPEIWAATKKVSGKDFSEKKLLSDIFQFLDPALLALPFDRIEKDLNGFTDLKVSSACFWEMNKEVFCGTKWPIGMNEPSIASDAIDVSFRDALIEDLHKVICRQPRFAECVEELIERLLNNESLSSLGVDVSRALMFIYPER